MLGKRKKSSSNKVSVPAAGSNTIAAGTYVEGNIKAESDIRIDGTMIGTLTCSGKVIIGAKGLVEGSVQCVQAVIDGTLRGDISVKEKLFVTAKSEIDGDVKCSDLEVEPGAQFNVICDMGSTITLDQSAPKKLTEFPANKQKVIAL